MCLFIQNEKDRTTADKWYGLRPNVGISAPVLSVILLILERGIVVCYEVMRVWGPVIIYRRVVSLYVNDVCGPVAETPKSISDEFLISIYRNSSLESVRRLRETCRASISHRWMNTRDIPVVRHVPRWLILLAKIGHQPWSRRCGRVWIIMIVPFLQKEGLVLKAKQNGTKTSLFASLTIRLRTLDEFTLHSLPHSHYVF